MNFKFWLPAQLYTLKKDTIFRQVFDEQQYIVLSTARQRDKLVPFRSHPSMQEEMAQELNGSTVVYVYRYPGPREVISFILGLIFSR